MIRLRDSRLGRAWVAIREDEDAAAAMGIPLMRTKTYAYAIGAFFGGAAGCLFALYKGATFPNDFYLNISIFILCMVILGGMGNVWGVCVGGDAARLPELPGPERGRQHVQQRGGHERQRSQVPVPGVRRRSSWSSCCSGPQGLIPSAQRQAELQFETDDKPSVARWRADERATSPRTAATCWSHASVRMEFGGLSRWTTSTSPCRAGSIVSLIGPNGAGKTTFFNMLTGVYTPTAGEIVFDGRRVGRLAAAQDHRSSASAARSRTSACSRR